MAPASFASSTSRVSRSAMRSISSTVSVRPSMKPPLMTSALLSLAKVFRALVASTGSPVMNAIAVGPTKSSSRPTTPASAAARLTRVFLATA